MNAEGDSISVASAAISPTMLRSLYDAQTAPAGHREHAGANRGQLRPRCEVVGQSGRCSPTLGALIPSVKDHPHPATELLLVAATRAGKPFGLLEANHG